MQGTVLTSTTLLKNEDDTMLYGHAKVNELQNWKDSFKNSEWNKILEQR